MVMKRRKALGAEYCQKYGLLKDTYGYSKVEMLVVLKAYQRYVSDVEAKKDSAVCGMLPDYYDIGPGVFHDRGMTIYIAAIKEIEPTFWDDSAESGRTRISDVGRNFVEQNRDLLEAAQEILSGVTRFRRG